MPPLRTPRSNRIQLRQRILRLPRRTRPKRPRRIPPRSHRRRHITRSHAHSNTHHPRHSMPHRTHHPPSQLTMVAPPRRNSHSNLRPRLQRRAMAPITPRTRRHSRSHILRNSPRHAHILPHLLLLMARMEPHPPHIGRNRAAGSQRPDSQQLPRLRR